jgi:hypothetical protein
MFEVRSEETSLSAGPTEVAVEVLVEGEHTLVHSTSINSACGVPNELPAEFMLLQQVSVVQRRGDVVELPDQQVQSMGPAHRVRGVDHVLIGSENHACRMYIRSIVSSAFGFLSRWPE